MTQDELDILLKHPDRLTEEMLPSLKELVEHYPYFAPARMLHLRALRMADSVLFDKELACTALYAHDRRRLYFFLYPEQRAEVRPKHVRASQASGSYFDLLHSVERGGGDVGQSLKSLAARLKQARLEVVAAEPPVPSGQLREEVPGSPVVAPEAVPAAPSSAVLPVTGGMEQVKVLVRGKKYADALVILKDLYLNNPEKSIYFADQIRFIEKIIENTKK